jgi:hypothetical protein
MPQAGDVEKHRIVAILGLASFAAQAVEANVCGCGQQKAGWRPVVQRVLPSQDLDKDVVHGIYRFTFVPQ